MTIRKIMCICMALVLALGCACALAEEDLQAQLDAANAKIEELQKQVDTYYPYYFAQIVATYGDDGIVWLDEVQAQYDAFAAQYEAYGISLAAYGMEDSVKIDVVDSAVETYVQLDKAAELGLDQFDEETEAEFEEEAQSSFDGYIDYYIQNVYPDAEEVTDDMRAEAESYWAANGMTLKDIMDSIRQNAILEAVYNYAIQDVEVTEEDIQAAYEALVEQNQSFYDNDRTYNSDRNAGVAIAWNPEGYRAVKHVLVKFSDEQAQKYSELQAQLSSLNAEREAILNPDEDAAEEAAETEPREIADVDADITACATEIEALYSQLLPTAEEVIEAFENGTDFDELIEEYNGDPGMQNEPTASAGYAVAETSTTWEQAFTDGAMSIENIGEISEPVYGNNGIHIIYYMADIEPGETGLEAVRDSVEQDAEEQKIQATYQDRLNAWLEEANVEYYYENFGVSAQ